VSDCQILLLVLCGVAVAMFCWFRMGRRISVTITSVTATDTSGRAWPHLCIEATNVSRRDVTVTLLELQLPSGASYPGGHLFAGPAVFFKNTPLPATLRGGDCAQLYVPYAGLGETAIQHGHRGIVSVRPACRAEGRTFKGKPRRVDIEEFFLTGILVKDTDKRRAYLDEAYARSRSGRGQPRAPSLANSSAAPGEGAAGSSPPGERNNCR